MDPAVARDSGTDVRQGSTVSQPGQASMDPAVARDSGTDVSQGSTVSQPGQASTDPAVARDSGTDVSQEPTVPQPCQASQASMDPTVSHPGQANMDPAVGRDIVHTRHSQPGQWLGERRFEKREQWKEICTNEDGKMSTRLVLDKSRYFSVQLEILMLKFPLKNCFFLAKTLNLGPPGGREGYVF